MAETQYGKFTEDDLEIDVANFDGACIMTLFRKCNERIEHIGRYMINFYIFTGEYWYERSQVYYDVTLCYVCVAVDNYGEFVTGIFDDTIIVKWLTLDNLKEVKPKITYNSFDYKKPEEYDTDATVLTYDLIDLIHSTNYTLQWSTYNTENHHDNIIPLMTNFFVPYLGQVRKLSSLNHNNVCL